MNTDWKTEGGGRKAEGGKIPRPPLSFLRPPPSALRLLLLLTCVHLCSSVAKSSDLTDPLIDSPMMHDPELPEIRAEEKLDERMRGLWVWGLDQLDADTVRRTADAINEAAEKLSKDVEDLAPRLTAVLDKPGQNHAVRLAAARALIRIGDKTAAASSLQHNQSDGPDMIFLTDPALGRVEVRTGQRGVAAACDGCEGRPRGEDVGDRFGACRRRRRGGSTSGRGDGFFRGRGLATRGGQGAGGSS